VKDTKLRCGEELGSDDNGEEESDTYREKIRYLDVINNALQLKGDDIF